MIALGVVVPFVRDWALTVLIEGVVLWFALAPAHPPRLRLLAALWLSTCTLPLVQFVFPLLGVLGWSRTAWLTAAELFAPAAECVLFALLVRARSNRATTATGRDMGAIVAANIASFGVGELLRLWGVR